jgi:hypothetical protein
LFHGQTFKMRQMACVFKGWYCDGDQPAEKIINLDMKLECSDVTVWSAYYHAEALTAHERNLITSVRQRNRLNPVHLAAFNILG